MSNKLKVMLGQGHNPFFNLATENWIFRDMDPSTKILFLWRNQDTVVIGRFQNPWIECNLAKMEQDKVLLARRQSGGGAVFHDLGNTNFTFLSGLESYDKSANFEIIKDALGKFGIKAQVSGRNDVVIETQDGVRKVSGSAFKTTKDRAFHHGTMLLNADLGRLVQYLNPDPRKLESKGIKSVKSRVMNLQELDSNINHDTLCMAMIDSFKNYYKSDCEIEILNDESLKNIPKLNNYYRELEDWNWRYGETPKFTHNFGERFEWGGIDIHLNAHKGKILEGRIFTDCLYPELIEDMQSVFKALTYDGTSIENAFDLLALRHPEQASIVSDVKSWCSQQVGRSV